MIKSEWAALRAALVLAVVVAALLAGGLWWAGEKAPDWRVGRRVPLDPARGLQRVPRVRLAGETRAAWRVPAGRRLRFSVTVPGDDPVLRFREGFLQGIPAVSVAVTTASGRRTVVHEAPASEGAWAVHRLPLPAEEGEALDIEIRALDGRGRKGLGEVFVTDVVLETDGRVVDETEAPVHERAIAADLLAGWGGETGPAPADPLRARWGLAGPACVPLPEGREVELRAPDAGADARLELVLHVAPEVTGGDADAGDPGDAAARWQGAPGALVLRRGEHELRRLGLDRFGPGRRELLLTVPLQGGPHAAASLHLRREGGAGLFAGVREAVVTAPRRSWRRPYRAGASRNLLLVVADSLRPDRIGCYGYGRAATPALDALAGRGVRFEVVRAPSSWTLPNVASLLTGTSPLTHGLGLAPLRVLSPRLITLPRVAAWAGLLTGGFSSNGWVGPDQGLDQGFAPFVVSVVPAPIVVEAALDWLADASDFEWLALVHVSDATHPHEPEARDLAAVDGLPDRALVERLRRLDSRPGAAEAMALELGPLYDAEVAGIDRAVGDMVAWLERRGLLADTVVAVVGCQGEEFFEHGGRLHGQTLHEEVVAVPVIIAGPGVPAGVVERRPIELVDVTSILATLVGLLPEGSMQGRLPPPFAEARDEPPPACSVLLPFATVGSARWFAAREGGWTWMSDGDGHRALYDLARDPGATSNRLVAGASAEDRLRAERLARRFDDWARASLQAAAAWPVPAGEGGP